MLEKGRLKIEFPPMPRRLVFTGAVVVLAAGTVTAQDPPPFFTQGVPGPSAILLGTFGDRSPSLATPPSVGTGRWQGSDATITEHAGSATSTQGERPCRAFSLPLTISVRSPPHRIRTCPVCPVCPVCPATFGVTGPGYTPTL